MALSRLTIKTIGPQGDGIALGPQGQTIFFERTAPGDEVEARFTQDKHGVFRGEVIKFHSLSPLRTQPPCPHFDKCGNCTLQHLALETYQKWKEEKVLNAFRAKKLSPKIWLKPHFLGGSHRRRATFSITKRKGKGVMGYYSRRSQLISEIETCDISLKELLDLKKEMEPLLFSFIKEGQTVDLFLQKASIHWELVFKGWEKPPKALLQELAHLTSICRISTQLSNGIQVLFERAPLQSQFGPLKVNLPPHCFLQPTAEGEKALVQAVVENTPPKSRIADLFCGAGTFSGPSLLKGEVSAYESHIHSVNALRKAGAKFPLKVFERDLFSRPLNKQELNRFDVVIFDPPRAGCLEQAQEMAHSSVPLLIGVSCNPATFARDASLLVRRGYELKSLQLFDQFLWSHHVEVVGVFTKS